MTDLSPSDRQRFRRLILKCPQHWYWTGSRLYNGAGNFSLDNTSHVADRIAYELWVGPIPAHHQVVQSCGVSHCLRPEHLVLVARGYHLHGNKNAARVTEDAVRFIRRNPERLTARQFARRLGICIDTVYDIQKRKTWKEVE
jgi:hypothetical protein